MTATSHMPLASCPRISHSTLRLHDLGGRWMVTSEQSGCRFDPALWGEPLTSGARKAQIHLFPFLPWAKPLHGISWDTSDTLRWKIVWWDLTTGVSWEVTGGEHLRTVPSFWLILFLALLLFFLPPASQRLYIKKVNTPMSLAGAVLPGEPGST